jgi:hypothetical protein
VAKWYARWQHAGLDGLIDRSSAPNRTPGRTPTDIEDLIEALRRSTKYGPARLAAELQRRHAITVAPATIHRILVRRGISRLRDIDPPTGEQLREVVRFEHDAPGSMIHVDVKKLGRIPAGGGWRIHGRGTDADRASKRIGPGTGRVGYTYLHSAVDDHSRLAYTEASTTKKATPPPTFGVAPRGSSPNTESPRSAVHSPTTGPATDHAPGQPPSARPAPSTGAPGPTPPAPTEKSKDSTARV